jgi:pyruvate,water dikinase
MSLVKSLDQIQPEDLNRVGGKCSALALLKQHGFRVPSGLCICFEAYRDFIGATGLKDRIHFELNRKRFEDMRWEEIWDASLRIRNMFAGTPIPHAIEAIIRQSVEQHFGERPLAVRSSALGEDSARMSFAGLHA